MPASPDYDVAAGMNIDVLYGQRVRKSGPSGVGQACSDREAGR